MIPRPSSIQLLCNAFEVSSFDLGFNLEETTEVNNSGNTIQIEEGSEMHLCIAQNLTTRLLVLAFTPLKSFQSLHDMMISIIEEYTMDMNTDKGQLTRREALRNLVTFPLITMNLSTFSQGKPRINTSHPEDILAQCATGIAACRELSKGTNSSDLALACDGVSAYTPVLKAIIRDSVQYKKKAANLVAQCARIKTALGRIGWQQENLQQATIHAQEAVTFAHIADDPALLISSQLSLAWVYYYDHRSQQGLQALQEALSTFKQYPSFEVRIYSAQAVFEAKTGMRPEATLRLAHTALHKSANKDYYVFSDEIIPELAGNESLAYYHARNYAKAADTFSQLINSEDLSVKLPLSGKAYAEMLNFMTLASLKNPQKDMEESLHLWDAAMQGAKTLQSRQRFEEVRAAYDIMDVLWSGEKAIEKRRELVMQW